MAGNITDPVMTIQQLTRYKQSLFELKKTFYEKLGGFHRIQHHLEHQIEEFSIYWKDLLLIVQHILDFCNRHEITLRYLSHNTTIAEWFDLFPPHRSEFFVMHVFHKYLISDFFSALPDGSEREFLTYHRNAIHKFEDLLAILQ